MLKNRVKKSIGTSLKKHTNLFVLGTFLATAVVILFLSIILSDIVYKGTELFFGRVPATIDNEVFSKIIKEVKQPKLIYEDEFQEAILDKLDSSDDKAKLQSFYVLEKEEYFGGLFSKNIYSIGSLSAKDENELKSLLLSISYNKDILNALRNVFIYVEDGSFVYKDSLIDFLLEYGTFKQDTYVVTDVDIKLLLEQYESDNIAADTKVSSISRSDITKLSLYKKAYAVLDKENQTYIKDNDRLLVEKGFRLIEYQYTPLDKFIGTSPQSGMQKGGVFSAIFGTIALVILMSFAVIPIGVITAIYLNEYAKNNVLTRLIRLAIHNLAGVPSIVFGLFGLGFFIQFVGTGIDDILYGGNLVYGKPAILWSALVLALLTLPVVIVSTEEALRNIPVDIRHASFALGATKFQTIMRIVIPNGLSGILTGAVLSVSRGVGEVAPILFTGAAYYLRDLPLSLNTQFMELGYHIYILATQSPDVEAVKPVLYSTVFVLLSLTFFLNLLAIIVRFRLRLKFSKYR